MIKKILMCLLLIVCIIPFASAITATYNTSTDSGGGGLGLYSNQLFNISVMSPANLTNLQNIQQDWVYGTRFAFGSTGAGTGSWDSTKSVPFTASISRTTGSNIPVGSGTITATYRYNNSPSFAYYDLDASFSTWNNTPTTDLSWTRVNLSYDGASLNFIPSYRNPTYYIPPGSTAYNTSGWFQITTPTENTAGYSPMSYAGKTMRMIYTHTPPPPATQELNFTATPTYGFTPLLVNFTASRTTIPSIVKWTFGDGTLSNTTTSSLTALHTYTAVGTYTVRLDTYDSTYGWQNFTRSEYIAVTNPSGVVFNVDIKDSISGALIQDAGFGVKNTTTGVWRNSTSPTGLLYVDSTDPGFLYPLSINQTITIAANKTGYGSASKTFQIPYDNYREYLYLVPSTVVNATGAGTVVATVISNAHGTPISGASVTLDTGQIGVTNSAGAVTLYNVTAGTRYANVVDPGYQTTSQSFTLTAGETRMLIIQLVRDGETPVPTFAQLTPTPVPTDTYGNPIVVPTDAYGNPIAGNTTSEAINQKGSSGLLGIAEFVIDLWPLIFFLGFLKFMRMCLE